MLFQIARHNLTRIITALLVLALTVPIVFSALERNGNALSVLSCLSSVIMAPFVQPQVVPPCASHLPVAMAVLASINGQTESTLESLIRAANAHSTFTDSLFGIAQSEANHVNSVWYQSPPGLAEYYALLALQAKDAGTTDKALEFFQRALTHRPSGWTKDFYQQYTETLAQADPRISEQLAQERSAPSVSVPQVKVGQKNQPGWDTPALVSNGWKLQGYALKSQTALDYGLPLDIELFWENPAGKVTRHSIETYNLVPNGGLQLGQLSGSSRVWGWLQRTEAIEYVSVPTALMQHNGRSSPVLVSSAPSFDDYRISRVFRVPSDSFLLWSTWIESDQGKPDIYIGWLDDHYNRLSDEILMRGNASSNGRIYAGVLRVPTQTVFAYLALVNIKSSGNVKWGDVMCTPLPLPISGQ